MLDHPKCHLVGDHISVFGNVLVVPKGASDNHDETGFGRAW